MLKEREGRRLQGTASAERQCQSQLECTVPNQLDCIQEGYRSAAFLASRTHVYDVTCVVLDTCTGHRTRALPYPAPFCPKPRSSRAHTSLTLLYCTRSGTVQNGNYNQSCDYTNL